MTTTTGIGAKKGLGNALARVATQPSLAATQTTIDLGLVVAGIPSVPNPVVTAQAPSAGFNGQVQANAKEIKGIKKTVNDLAFQTMMSQADIRVLKEQMQVNAVNTRKANNRKLIEAAMCSPNNMKASPQEEARSVEKMSTPNPTFKNAAFNTDGLRTSGSFTGPYAGSNHPDVASSPPSSLDPITPTSFLKTPQEWW